MSKKRKMSVILPYYLESGGNLQQLSTPVAMEVTQVDSTSITWKVALVLNADTYIFERATMSNFSDASVIQSGSSRVLNDTGLTSNTLYYYRCKARRTGYIDSYYISKTIGANALTIIGKLSSSLGNRQHVIEQFRSEQDFQWDMVVRYVKGANQVDGDSVIDWSDNNSNFNWPSGGANLIQSELGGTVTDGTNENSHIDTNIDLASAFSGYDDAVSMGCYIKRNFTTATNRSLFGCAPTSSVGRIELQQRPSAAQISGWANDGTALAISEGIGDDKLFDNETDYCVVQDEGVGKYYKDGILVYSSARVADALTSIKPAFGGSRFQSTDTVMQLINASYLDMYFVQSRIVVMSVTRYFDFRSWHLSRKKMFMALGCLDSVPELTVEPNGEWFDFSTDSLGTFVSHAGRRANFTAVAASSAPDIVADNGINVAEFDGSEAIDLSSNFNTFFDAEALDILLSIKPTDGTPATEQCLLGARNGTNRFEVYLTTSGTIRVDFQESTGSVVSFETDDPCFNDTPTEYTTIRIQVLKEPIQAYCNGIKMRQTNDSFGSMTVGAYDGGTRNFYLGALNNGGSITNGFIGRIGDCLIKPYHFSQSQATRLEEYF